MILRKIYDSNDEEDPNVDSDTIEDFDSSDEEQNISNDANQFDETEDNIVQDGNNELNKGESTKPLSQRKIKCKIRGAMGVRI